MRGRDARCGVPCVVCRRLSSLAAAETAARKHGCASGHEAGLWRVYCPPGALAGLGAAGALVPSGAAGAVVSSSSP
jgi:hypothetical protein